MKQLQEAADIIKKQLQEAAARSSC
jgi:hypothetical protein